MAIIIDATNLIAGRLAAYTAKKALEGEQIEIINSDKAIVTGNKKNVLTRARAKVERGDPHHGPFYPKSAERVLRRMIRGMLPYQQSRGRVALKRIKCYRGNEEGKTGITFEQFSISKLKKLRFMTLGELSKEIKG